MVGGFGTLHLSSGDMLREHRQKGTDLGEQAVVFMDAGELVPDSLIIAMVMDRLSGQDAGSSWILDGFPRTLPQARSLDESLEQAYPAGPGLTHVVYFVVPQEILIGRLTGRRSCSQCGAIWHLEFKPTRQEGICDTCGGELTQRSDDRAEVVSTRLDEYHRQTEPLLDYYRNKGVLIEVDANQAPDAVFDELIERLKIERSPS